MVDGRLAQHGVDAEKISWDAYRRDDGTWRIVATWPSGKATAQAVWELDKTRQNVTPHDDMAQYLCTERPTPILGQDPPGERPGRGLAAPVRGETSRGDLGRGGGHEPMRPAADPTRRERPGRALPPADPIRSGRDALLASLERPLTAEAPGRPGRPWRGGPPGPAGGGWRGRAARRRYGRRHPVGLRVRRRPGRAEGGAGRAVAGRPAAPAHHHYAAGGSGLPGRWRQAARKRLPSWDDVLFGSAPARESS